MRKGHRKKKKELPRKEEGRRSRISTPGSGCEEEGDNSCV